MNESPSRIQPMSALKRVNAALRVWFKNESVQHCLADGENCPRPVIRAHSVQSSHILDVLAEDGYVYMITPYSDQGECVLERIGRHKATTFTGFCNRHDSAIFREIDFADSRPFDRNNPRQIVLLSLRSVAKEYWAKLNVRKLFGRLVRLAKDQDFRRLAEQLNLDEYHASRFVENLDDFASPYLEGTKLSSKRLQRVFNSCMTQLSRNRYHLTHWHVFQLPRQTNVAVSASINPEFDLNGERIGGLDWHRDVIDVSLNVFPDTESTWVVFSYHRRGEQKLKPLFDQLASLHRKELCVFLTKMILIHSENFVLSPRYVARLSEKERELIQHVFDETAHVAMPYESVPDIDFFAEKRRSNGG